ncbi:MAG: hypothetical protein DKT66_22425 [Candidatus Melainabacteria bacterium]|nr:MAG: hypothetical protein DKT66_22425 [Candidatus Melainabacteria bacterium]
MGLFGTKTPPKGTVESVVAMLSDYFKRRKLDMDGHALDGERDSCGWWLMEGSAKVYIFLQEDKSGKIMLRVTSPIVHFPDTDRERFFQRCLELNQELNCCSLSSHEEIILVTSQRPIAGLDQEELNTLIWNVSHAADVIDDLFSQEFRCRVYDDR